MKLKKYLLFILLLITSNHFVIGQDITSDSCKKLFMQNVLVQYWSEGIPKYIIEKYECFFLEILKDDNLTLNDFTFVKAFPVNETYNFLDSIDFIEIDDSTYTTNGVIPIEYCVIIFKTLPQNGKVYNYVFILDSSLNKIIRKDFIFSKVRINKEIYFDVLDPPSSSNGVFRLLVSEKKKKAILPKPEFKKEYLYYFDDKMKLKRKRIKEKEGEKN